MYSRSLSLRMMFIIYEVFKKRMVKVMLTIDYVFICFKTKYNKSYDINKYII